MSSQSSSSSSQHPPRLQHVGIIGAGIGGLACAIATRRHTAHSVPVRVTILEAAHELGEIGAGIQMTPNVARLLVRWGVADVIGPQLVTYERLNLRTKEGRLVGRTEAPGNGGPEKWAGAPWWLVHRMHLHEGLVTVARREGVEVVTGARVAQILQSHDNNPDNNPNNNNDNRRREEEEGAPKVSVKDESGRSWEFDLVIGADGVNSITRRTILPHVQPRPPTNAAAYRAVVPMALLRADPLTAELAQRREMNVWMGFTRGQAHGYIITYPISGGDVLNVVLTHHRRAPVTSVEAVSLAEVRRTYQGYDPRIRRVLALVPAAQTVRRWPLLVTRCPRWSTAHPAKNIVLLGDAAHAMVNHLAQGAATSMEDGAFLGVLLREVAKGTVGLAAAVAKYEEARMPLADLKQQKSFVMGEVYHMEEGSVEQAARDRHMEPELRGEQLVRTPNLNADPHLWQTIFGYDPEAHAERAVEELLAGSELRNPQTWVTRDVADTYMNYWLPDGDLRVKSLL